MHNTVTRFGRLALGALALGVLVGVTGEKVAAQGSGTPVRYDQGNPSDDEQYLLQKLNRARMDPVGEGQRLAAWLRANPAIVNQYGVNPDKVASDFAALPAVPPLAFNADLLASARSHSSDLGPHDGVGPGGDDHAGYDGSTPDSRVYASGFRSASNGDGFAGENVDPGSDNLDEVHAAYLVDWGVADLGHRLLEMSGSNAMNVVGIGLATKAASVDKAFPIVNTSDFGMPGLSVGNSGLTNADVPAILTGVVYADTNGNGQYDPGEGVAGATVSMDGGAYYAVTTASGGYSLPLVNADGTNASGTVPVRVTFAAGGVFTATGEIVRYATAYGSYRGNVEWDVTAGEDEGVQPVLAPSGGSLDPNMPYFNGVLVTASAGELIKVKVFRPENSDINQPYTFGYKLKGTAVSGVDYAALPKVATVPSGKTNVKIKVNALAGSGNVTTVKLKLPGVKYRGASSVTIMP